MNNDASGSKDGGFLPDITKSGRSTQSRKSNLVENDGNPLDRNGRSGNKNNLNMGDQIQFANEAFKDSAVLQGKLQA